MRKKELKKEIERLKNLCSSLHMDLEIIASDGREFEKAMVIQKHKDSKRIQNLIWSDCDNNTGGLPNGFYNLLQYKDIPL